MIKLQTDYPVPGRKFTNLFQPTKNWSTKIMCTSPDTWSTEMLEEYIQEIKEMLDSAELTSGYRRLWEGRLKGYQDILKERAENGTYATS